VIEWSHGFQQAIVGSNPTVGPSDSKVSALLFGGFFYYRESHILSRLVEGTG